MYPKLRALDCGIRAGEAAAFLSMFNADEPAARKLLIGLTDSGPDFQSKFVAAGYVSARTGKAGAV
jgi:hypothetical protein